METIIKDAVWDKFVELQALITKGWQVVGIEDGTDPLMGKILVLQKGELTSKLTTFNDFDYLVAFESETTNPTPVPTNDVPAQS